MRLLDEGDTLAENSGGKQEALNAVEAGCAPFSRTTRVVTVTTGFLGAICSPENQLEPGENVVVVREGVDLSMAGMNKRVVGRHRLTVARSVLSE